MLAAWVASGTAAVQRYQRRCGVTPEGPTNPVLHPIFAIGSSMGNEIFFLCFHPAVILGLDAEVARRTMVCWAAIYYIGQVLKDALRLPRPPVSVKLSQAHVCAACPARCGGAWCGGRRAGAAAPAAAAAATAPAPAPAKGVVCLETHYAAEYGMPSTHAMCSVGLPWALVAWTVRSGRFQGDLSPLVAFAGFYTFATTLSRPYMGVHSPADVIVGLLLGAGILAADLAVGSAVDAWVLRSPLAPLALPALLAALMLAYPRPRPWKSSPGDTVLVVASTCGVLLAAAVDSQAKAAGAAGAFGLPSLLLPGAWGDAALVGRALARAAVTAAACAGTRAALKPLCVALLSALLGPAYGNAEDISAGARVGDTPMHLLKGTGVEPPSPAGFGRSSSTQWGGSSGSASPSGASSSRSSGSGEGAWEGPLGVHKRHSASASSASSSSSAGEASAAAGSGGSGGGAAADDAAGAAAAGSEGAAAAPPLAQPHRTQQGEPLLIRAPADKVLVPPEQRYAIEIPTKMVVYGAIGFVIMYVVPRLFALLRI